MSFFDLEIQQGQASSPLIPTAGIAAGTSAGFDLIASQKRTEAATAASDVLVSQTHEEDSSPLKGLPIGDEEGLEAEDFLAKGMRFLLSQRHLTTSTVGSKPVREEITEMLRAATHKRRPTSATTVLVTPSSTAPRAMGYEEADSPALSMGIKSPAIQDTPGARHQARSTYISTTIAEELDNEAEPDGIVRVSARKAGLARVSLLEAISSNFEVTNPEDLFNGTTPIPYPLNYNQLSILIRAAAHELTLNHLASTLDPHTGPESSLESKVDFDSGASALISFLGERIGDKPVRKHIGDKPVRGPRPSAASPHEEMGLLEILSNLQILARERIGDKPVRKQERAPSSAAAAAAIELFSLEAIADIFTSCLSEFIGDKPVRNRAELGNLFLPAALTETPASPFSDSHMSQSLMIGSSLQILSQALFDLPDSVLFSIKDRSTIASYLPSDLTTEQLSVLILHAVREMIGDKPVRNKFSLAAGSTAHDDMPILLTVAQAATLISSYLRERIGDKPVRGPMRAFYDEDSSLAASAASQPTHKLSEVFTSIVSSTSAFIGDKPVRRRSDISGSSDLIALSSMEDPLNLEEAAYLFITLLNEFSSEAPIRKHIGDKPVRGRQHIGDKPVRGPIQGSVHDSAPEAVSASLPLDDEALSLGAAGAASYPVAKHIESRPSSVVIEGGLIGDKPVRRHQTTAAETASSPFILEGLLQACLKLETALCPTPLSVVIPNTLDKHLGEMACAKASGDVSVVRSLAKFPDVDGDLFGHAATALPPIEALSSAREVNAFSSQAAAQAVLTDRPHAAGSGTLLEMSQTAMVSPSSDLRPSGRR